MNKLFRIKNLGFTLIEMIVSVGVISLVLVGAVGIYIFTIGPQQKITASANLQQDGQYILNAITKDARGYLVNYNYYGVVVNPIEYLALVDDLSTPTIYTNYRLCQSGAHTDCVPNQVCALKKCTLDPASCGDCTSENWRQVTMADVSIEKFESYIKPTTNPFVSGSIIYQSPQITVILELKSYKEKTGEHRLKLQQTINQRYQEKGNY